MVRISSKVSHHRIQQKKTSVTPSIEINSNPIDQSSSKILNVVRQALLNAAEELVSQQQQQENLNENSIPFHTFDMHKSSHQRNGNSIKKKKLIRKNKKISKKNRRK
jgi:hypothetical protein